MSEQIKRYALKTSVGYLFATAKGDYCTVEDHEAAIADKDAKIAAKDARIEELEMVYRDASAHADSFLRSCREQKETIAAKDARIAELEGALRFYADENNYVILDISSAREIGVDGGAKARAALDPKS